MVAFGDNLKIFGIYYPYLCLNVMFNNIHLVDDYEIDALTVNS